MGCFTKFVPVIITNKPVAIVSVKAKLSLSSQTLRECQNNNDNWVITTNFGLYGGMSLYSYGTGYLEHLNSS